MAETKKRMWSGRFAEEQDPRVDALNASIGFDQRLALEDIAGNLAHSRMLHRIGVLSREDLDHVEQGLAGIRAEVEAGDFEFREDLEDIHMNIEAALTAKIGPAGGRIHTGRSRNDQVAVDFRLHLRRGIDDVTANLDSLRAAFVSMAGDHLDVILPGYTHLQRAQPVRLGFHWLAYYQMISRDRDRFTEARRRLNRSPLGGAALAGTTFGLDREMTAAELGFDGVMPNAMDAVADRDFALDFLYASAVLGVHLSRLAEELILWSSQEYGFIELADTFCTGSSIMPQKKNPDIAELTRGKSGRVIGNLVALLTVLKGLPMAYNKDLQEDKEPVFDSLDTVLALTGILPDMLVSMKVNSDRMRAACADGFLEATDLADWLVGKGVPFREAHHQAGAVVKHCIGKGSRIGELSLKEMQTLVPLAEAGLFDHLTLESLVDRRSSQGGPARSQVEMQIAAAREELAADGFQWPGQGEGA